MISNNFILFNLYIGFVFVFLVLLNIFLMNYVIDIFYNEIKLNQLNRIIELQEIDIYKLINIYIKKKKWLICISLLELYFNLNIFSQQNIIKYLAYCYEENNCFSLALYYYQVYLSINSNDINILQKILLIYKKIDNYELLNITAKNILKLDSNNLLAQKYLSI